MFVDALRYELGVALQQQLAEELIETRAGRRQADEHFAARNAITEVDGVPVPDVVVSPSRVDVSLDRREVGIKVSVSPDVRGVEADGPLAITLKRKGGSRPPLLCGVEIVRE